MDTDLQLDAALVREAVESALREDLGWAGDLTGQATLAPTDEAFGVIVARAPGVVSGLALAVEAFGQRSSDLQIRVFVSDGASVGAGEELIQVRGNARAILSAERTALNFLGHLSGIATATRELVDLVAGTRARLACTRKTTPGLRALEKYAVRCGGGFNHRFGLFDAVMVKDNHIVAAGGIERAVARARSMVGHLVKIEVEVGSLDELDSALNARADVVMLDNMTPAQVSQAVARAQGRATLEASGGITRANIRAYAETGVDVISVGWITHSAPRLDVALDLRQESNFI